MVYPGYSRQSGPDPVNAQDLATKHYVDADWGVSAADLNTLTTGGTYIAADTNANPPSFPTGQYFLDVRHVGAVLQQRATHIALPNYIATRFYNGTTWGAWHSPAAGMIYQGLGPGSSFSGAASTVWQPTGLSIPVVNGRKYRYTLWFYCTNNSGAALAFIYFTVSDNLHLSDGQTPNARIVWMGAPIGSGQSWFGSGSHSVLPGASGTITNFTVAFNASASPIAIGANALELVFEDMGI